MKKGLLCLLGIILISFYFTKNVHSNSDGSPGNYSGSGGVNCSNCHGGKTVNDGNGLVRATILDKNNNVVTSYVGGLSYKIGIKVKGKSASAWGFAAATKSSSAIVGIFSTSSSNTKVKSSGSYATHSNANSDSFTINWTAPSKGTGNVTLYLCGNAANGDGGDGGDNIYTSTKLLTESNTSSIDNTVDVSNEFKIFASGNGQINISSLNDDHNFQYQIVNLNGQIIDSRVSISGNSIVTLSQNLIGQILFVKVNNSKGENIKKIVLN